MITGSAISTPAIRTPTVPASTPSASDATGLLPAQAIAHTAITLASLAGPASTASSVLAAEFATRQTAPARNAKTTLTHTAGASTKQIMHAPSANSTLAVSLIDVRCLDRRMEPITLPEPSAAMNAPDHPSETWNVRVASAGPSTSTGSAATVTAATMSSTTRIRGSRNAIRNPARTRDRRTGSGRSRPTKSNTKLNMQNDAALLAKAQPNPAVAMSSTQAGGARARPMLYETESIA